MGPAVGFPAMSDTAPTRYRCTACGNLTRFDVTSTRRERSFHHYTVGGELSVEDVEVLAEEIEAVSCRWCGTSAAVAAVAPGELADGDDASAPAEVSGAEG
jgi:hypothetical protein